MAKSKPNLKPIHDMKTTPQTAPQRNPRPYGLHPFAAAPLARPDTAPARDALVDAIAPAPAGRPVFPLGEPAPARPAGRHDCNRSAMAGLDAMNGLSERSQRGHAHGEK